MRLLRRIPKLIFTICFVGFLVLEFVIFPFKPKAETSYYENRTLAQQPTLSLSALWDGSFFDELDAYLSDHALGRETLIRLHTDIDLNVLHRLQVNDIIPSDGKLLYDYGICPIDTETLRQSAADMADQLQLLNDRVTSYGGVFLYVAVPGQTNYYADSYPSCLQGAVRYYSAVRDVFVDEMQSRDIPILDMEPVFAQQGNPDWYYFATDHHYSCYGALATYQAAQRRINALTGDPPRYLNTDDFDFETISNPFTGSRGRKIYNLTDIHDTLVIEHLRNPVAFRRFDNGVEVQPTLFSLPEDTQTSVSYAAFMGGDKAETILQTDRPELPNLLIFGDSFTNAFETIIYADYNETRSLDLRYYEDMGLLDYVAQFQPDVVICLRDYTGLLESEGNGTIR